MIRWIVVACAIAGPTIAQVQRVSVGFVAGGYANKDFVSHYYLAPDPPPPPFTPRPLIARSEAGGYIVGPTVEVNLIPGLSVAVDALYKPLHYKASVSFYADGSIGFAPATVVTWQFPLLARYRFSPAPARPFLEAGPSFRTTGNLNQSRPSSSGFSVGAGLEGKWLGMAYAPSIRYTRWARDPDPLPQFPSPGQVRTRPDQLEFMIRFTWGFWPR